MLLAKHILKDKNGFTLIEVLLTLVVFSVGLVAIYTLSVSNLNVTRDNFQRTLAANLGREAIELVRNQRDSNWLAIEANADCDASDAYPICTWDYALTAPFVTVAHNQSSPTDISGLCLSLDDCLALSESKLYLHNDLLSGIVYYDHDSTNARMTDINRAIALQPICRDTTKSLLASADIVPAGLLCDPGTEKIGVQVSARVQWYFLGQKRSLDLVERIYNWR